MKNYFLLFLCLMAFAACRHTPIESNIETPKPIGKPWERVDLYKYYSTNILSSYSTDSMLFSASAWGLTMWDKRKNTDFSTYLLSWGNNTFNPRPMFSDRIVATMSDSLIVFKSVFYPSTSPNPDLQVKSGSIRPNYRFGNISKMGAFSNFIGNKVYFVTSLGNSDVTGNNASIALLELEYTAKPDDVVKLLKTTFFPLNGTAGNIVTAIQFVGNQFFIGNASPLLTYTLDLSGNLKKIEIPMTNQVLQNFFALGKDSIMGVGTQNEMFLSTDNGRSFSFYASVTSNTGLVTLKYHYFKNRLFIHNKINFYEWNLSNNKFIEYDKTGVPDYLFMNNFHLIKDTLFITTEGGGVYQKAFSDLIEK
jgi:hypothetical protein